MDAMRYGSTTYELTNKPLCCTFAPIAYWHKLCCNGFFDMGVEPHLLESAESGSCL
jgi:hypothetical protein